jgi:hypothetical protein
MSDWERLPPVPKHPKWILQRMVYDKEYTQGILYADGIFVCYTHEFPEGASDKHHSGKCVPCDFTYKMKYDSSQYFWYAAERGVGSFKFAEDPDNLRTHDIAVGLKCTPHGGIVMAKEAMARLRALGHRYKTPTLKIQNFRDTPPDWMEPWIAKSW